MARKFLYAIAALVVLAIAVLVMLRLFAEDITSIAMVPATAFERQPALARNAYVDPAMWYSHPAKSGGIDPARWLPADLAEDADGINAALFFIHPTSYQDRRHWNAPVGNALAEQQAELFIRANATPFNKALEIWAPRYRQATFGAFLTDRPEATQALETAYGDVLAAFDQFIAASPKDRWIILAGHSQGTFHLKRLLRDRVAGTPLARRIIAVYAIGWPISLAHDLPATGLPACAAPDQRGCVISYLSFAEPADNAMLVKAYARRTALDGMKPGGSPFLCSNPLTGVAGGAAPAAANLGTLVPSVSLTSAKLVPAMVPAACGADGFLSIGDPPKIGPFVLPGNNYHLYDVPLFWANLRADLHRRVLAGQP